MNKNALIAEVSKRTGGSKAEVGRTIDATIRVIRDAVSSGERVSLVGFGTFERRKRNQRIARNPRQPQTPIVVPARDLPWFTPGKEFKDAVSESRSRVAARPARRSA
jgi:DNA-binding protein HU-beta